VQAFVGSNPTSSAHLFLAKERRPLAVKAATFAKLAAIFLVKVRMKL
jgi:hypothetical protein